MKPKAVVDCKACGQVFKGRRATATFLAHDCPKGFDRSATSGKDSNG